MANVYDLLGIKPPEQPAGEAAPQPGPNSPLARLAASGAGSNIDGRDLLRRGIISSGFGTQGYGATERFEEGAAKAGKLATAGKEAAAPIAGEIAGQVVGRRLLGKPGELVGESVGSVAGEAFNQATGITEPSLTQLGYAAAAPITGRGVAEGVRRGVPAVAKRLPGASVELQKEGVERARAISAPYTPRVSSEKLYDLVEHHNPRIKVPNLRKALNDVLLTEVQLDETGLQGPVKAVAEKMLQKLSGHGDEVPFQEIRAIQRRLGQRTGVVQGLEANELRGAFKHVVAGLDDDLDAAASTSGKGAGKAASLLKRAQQTYRKEESVKTLTTIIEGSVNKGRSDLLESFNPARALKAIDEDEFLRKSFTRKELGEIQASLRGLKGLPSLPPPGGEAAIGSGRVMTRLAIGATGGAAAGGMLGGPTGGAIGSTLGLAAAQGTHELIAKVVATDAGRKVLMKMIRAKGGVLDNRSLAILAQYGRAQTTTPGEPDLGDEGGNGKD